MTTDQKLTAHELAQLVKDGDVSSRDLVSAAIQRINEGNPAFNAVVTLRETLALAEAEQLVDKGQPFLGIPILIKGLGQSLKGMPDTAGSTLLKDQLAALTDNFVQGLQRAGFIVIGQTNVPEFGFKNITDATLYGPARNPWNPQYQPGGSSGGAAASVSAGWVPIAAGSDGGGSIRIPASWTGTIGLKPTRGRVPVGPVDFRAWQGAAINFALTRDVLDTAMLLDALTVVQPEAVFQTPLPARPFVQQLNQPLAGLTVGVTTTSPVGTPVSEAAKLAVQQAANFLSDQGLNVVPVANPVDGLAAMNAYYLMNEGETAAMINGIEQALGRPVTATDVEPLTWALYQTGRHVTAAQYSQALSVWDQAAAQMATLHRQYPLLLSPATATTAPKVGDPLISPAHQAQMAAITDLSPAEQQQFIFDQWLPALTRSPFTQQANLTGEPAISLPTAVSDTGLPIGIQLIAQKGGEGLLLAIARLFEKQQQFSYQVQAH